ncbi:hypothetical protein [Metasolibacillus sp.]|uniref:hypothetical protein n=1 Tax=Metasolibacillus sp. TaxID=2703680 RepID=UPI0025D80283|nr:hypothetical protein [Metasolibacillus sp.]MCT6925279.1 hypothetical protein [Metasolibacillus sp.]MCT6941491.1 hypothetical protein [Metasolibacillus sp.]
MTLERGETTPVSKPINDPTKKLYWDIDDIIAVMPYQRSFLINHVLSDPRIQRLEKRFGPRSKKIWPREQVTEAIHNIIATKWE